MTDSINLRTIIGDIDRALKKQIFEFKLLRKSFRVESETHDDRIQAQEEALKKANLRIEDLEEKLEKLAEFVNIREDRIIASVGLLDTEEDEESITPSP